MAQQGFRIRTVAREAGDAGGDAEEDLVPGNLERAAYGIHDAARQACGVRAVAQARQQYGEFIPAQTGDHGRFLGQLALGQIPAAHGFAQAAAHRFKQAVAFANAEGVVDAFETVEIEEQDSALFTRFGGFPGDALDFLAEAFAVGKLGDHVHIGKAVDAFHRGVEPREHAVEGVRQHFQFIAGIHLDAQVQLARGGETGGFGQAAHRTQRLADDQRDHRQEDDQATAAMMTWRVMMSMAGVTTADMGTVATTAPIRRPL